MRLQILIDIGNDHLGDKLSHLRKHANQFGDARDFMTWGEKHSDGLVRFLVPAGSLKAYLFDARTPEAAAVAICHEDEWNLQPGRVIHYGGRVVCALIRTSFASDSVSPAEVDGLARRIVALLNEKQVEL